MTAVATTHGRRGRPLALARSPYSPGSGGRDRSARMTFAELEAGGEPGG